MKTTSDPQRKPPLRRRAKGGPGAGPGAFLQEGGVEAEDRP